MKTIYNVIPILFIFFSISLTSCAQKQQEQTPRTPIDRQDLEGMEKATLAGGCFWCVEAVFERVEGVKAAISGYTGGTEENPTYEEVSGGNTSHAEAVEIYYNPEVISYGKILEIFFATHDPTTLNRQGPDVGAQYRSAVYYHNEDQKEQAEQYIASIEKSGEFDDPVVTELVPYTEFYEAEDYHQDYYELNPGNPYIISVTKPKINKFVKEYDDLLKKEYQ